MAIYSGVLPQQQQYGAMSSRASDVPFTQAGVVTGAPQTPTEAGTQAQPQSPNVLPDWAAANVAQMNPWAMNTVTGGMNMAKAAQNYAALSRQYGGANPQEWTPWQQKDVAARGAGGFGNVDILINPTYRENIGKDFMMKQTGSNKGLFTRDIERNPYTGEILGYGGYSEINPTGGKDFGKKFFEQRIYPETGKNELPSMGKPDYASMRKQLDAQAKSYMAQNPDLFNAAVNTGMEDMQRQLALAILLNAVPNYEQYGVRPGGTTYLLGPWKSLLGQYGGDSRALKRGEFVSDIYAKNYNPYSGPVYGAM